MGEEGIDPAELRRRIVVCFSAAELKQLAEALGVKSVDVVDDTLQVRFHDRPPIDPGRVIELIGPPDLFAVHDTLAAALAALGEPGAHP